MKIPDKTLNTRPKAAKTTNSEPGHIQVVGIGASAGGLQALEEFFTNVPVDSGMSFVVIQHLDPAQKGMLAELLQRYTKMPVSIVTDGLKIKPNAVYVIPSNTSMSVLNNVLYLFEPVEIHGLRLPIDFFFHSLAEDQQEKSIGMILSGMGSDGSEGLKTIKENGGIAMVQEPTSAKFDSMPRSAIEAVIVDIVAPAHELAKKLINVSKLIPKIAVQPDEEKDTSSIEKIILLLRIQTGNDFSQYKKNTLYRRIERRMVIHQVNKITSYVRYLQENPAEVNILFKELLIGVTNFFRDKEVWKYLKDKALPLLMENADQPRRLRAWIPGCSTGEEAYSLAIVFKEALEKMNPNNNFSLQIFATDLDEVAVEKARKGTFSDHILADVSAERLKRFFVKTNDKYRVNAEIREMVVFASQNVIKDPPFTKLDILLCRNLMIYLDAGIQKKLLEMFHYSLNTGGILVLGSAETNAAHSDLFSVIDSKCRIYQSTGNIPKDNLINFPSSFASRNQAPPEDNMETKVPDNIQKLTDQLLLQQYSPASLLCTPKGDILYITGSTGKYLEPAAGKANMNIFTMAREGLRHELPMAFRAAMQNYEKVVLHNLRIGTNPAIHLVDVTLQQIEKPSALKGKMIVVFNDAKILEQESSNKKRSNTASNTLVAELEFEIKRVNEELQSTRDEMMISQEELQSTNEELQSTNEELQSANEELTTSKEEMQSMNEELHIVNIELQSKIDDSTRVNNDMNNLLNSIEIATMFLDRDLKIRQFTPRTINIFKLIQSDIGRPFSDQVTDLIYPELYDDAKEVLRTLVFVEKAKNTLDGRWFNIRIMPYRTFEDKIDGLVITFVDITKSKQLEQALKETQTILQSFIQTVPGVIIGLSFDGKIIEFNPEAEKLFNCKREDVMSKKYVDLFIHKSLREQVKADMQKLLAGQFPSRFVNIVKTLKDDELTIEWSAYQLLDEQGKRIGLIAIGVNISPSKDEP
ncbi:MAG TPA: chemotaxis protein CheB [Prolixibacteraceae bacterium]|nr:chemotaxis protein CheB [Prolixibacteraceae bacterium]